MSLIYKTLSSTGTENIFIVPISLLDPPIYIYTHTRLEIRLTSCLGCMACGLAKDWMSGLWPDVPQGFATSTHSDTHMAAACNRHVQPLALPSCIGATVVSRGQTRMTNCEQYSQHSIAISGSKPNESL